MKRKTVKLLLKIFSILTILVVLFVAGVNIFMIQSTGERIYTLDEINFFEADCILVLGAGVRNDGTPSHMLEDRIITGVSVFDSVVCNTILMSGDHGRIGYDEVNTMKSYAIKLGVTSERIFMDHAGFSTYDSLYRALAIADSLGIEAVGVPADLRTYSGQLSREVREIAARVKDFFYIIFKPDPTYLGEPISLGGSGEVTNG